MDVLTIVCVGAAGVSVMCSCLCVLFVRALSAEQRKTNVEIFGLVKKLEGLTAHRREQLLCQYDQLVENLAKRIPALIAAHAGEKIFETESTILARLAELEPILSKEGDLHKLDEVVKSMEALEKTVVAHTATAIQSVMLENRRTIFDNDPVLGNLSHS